MKHTLTLALLFIATLSFGQGRTERPTQMPKANREFVTPFAFYATDTIKAYRLGLFATVDDNVGVLVVKYALFNATGNMLKGSEGFVTCDSGCYTSFDANDNNSAFQLVVDKVIHRALK